MMKRLLMILSFIFPVVFGFGCQDRQALAELDGLKAQAAVEEQNIELVRHFFDELNLHNVAIYDELCAPDYRWHFPSNNPEPFSRDQEKEFLNPIWLGFPDISWTIEDIFAADDKVSVRFIARGTHDGEYQGIAPTGETIEVSGILIYQIENGQLVDSWEDSDALGMMQQLGMELQPAVAED